MFQVPNLHAASCRELSVCAHLVNPDKQLTKWLAKLRNRAARTKTPGGVVYVLEFGGDDDDDENHFHLQLITKEVVAERAGKNPTPPSNKFMEVKNDFERMVGHEADVLVKGSFSLTQDRFPTMIRSSLLSVKSRDVELKTTGGRIEVSGAPIDQIVWTIPKGETHALVIIQAKRTITLADSYLVDQLHVLKSAFDAFIVG